jgi:hypothetical protein
MQDLVDNSAVLLWPDSLSCSAIRSKWIDATQNSMGEWPMSQRILYTLAWLFINKYERVSWKEFWKRCS